MSDRSQVESMPWSAEAEDAVLSCFLQNPETLLDDAATSIPADAFYHPANRLLFETISRMNTDGKPIDTVTVSQHLLDCDLMAKVGGPARIAELLTFVPTAAHYPYYKKIMREKWMTRRVILLCTEGIAKCREATDPDEPPVDVLNHLDEALLALRQESDENRGSGPQTLNAVLCEVLDALDRARRSQGKILGIRTGIPDLDRTINGLEPPDVFFIAARPGMGKTNLMIYIMIYLTVTLAEDGVPAFCLSLEMSSLQLVRRALLSEAGVEQSKGRTGFFSEERIHGANSDEARIKAATRKFGKGTLWLDDTPELTISEVRARIRQMKRKHGIKVVLLDYAQIILPVTKKGLSEERLGIAEVCQGLKAVAKQCQVVMIVLAQASRGSEDNPGAKPKLRDLDGSSAMEKWADFVAFIHRPSRFKSYERLSPDEKTYYGTEQNFLEAVELLLQKGRECGEAVIPLRFVHKLARFEPKTMKVYSNNPNERQHNPPDDD